MTTSIQVKLLTQKGLSVTHVREQLLGLFLNAQKPLSRQFIEEQAKEWADRVTIYRNLIVLTEKGIIRKISADEGGLYLLVYKKERKQHLHFQCRNCHEIFCFENIEIEEKRLPKNFKIENIEFTATGLCEKCLKS